MLIKDIIGSPYPVRKQLINELQSSNSKPSYEYPLKFQNRINTFKVYTIPLEMPKYRLSNGRTQALQQVHIAKNPSLSSNYFETDFESIEKHLIQHNILKGMVENDLINFFKKESQDRPLIIDQDGFVINGNRRLCAMRELYLLDSQEYSRFSHIDVLILPPCSEKDKDELEADLQIKKDIKQDYDWVSEGFMYRKRMQEHGYTIDEISKMYDKNKNEINARIDMLTYAEEYLLSIGKPKQYNLVTENTKFAFEAIVDSRKRHNNKSEAYKNILKDINYIVLHDNQTNNLLDSGRIYNVINKISEHFLPLIETFEAELQEEISNVEMEMESEVLDLFGTTETTNNNIIKLSQAIGNPENKEKVLNIIKDTIERQEILKKEKANSKAALKFIQKAHSDLVDALNVFDDQSDTTGIIEQLNQITNLIQQLREKVNNEIIH
ncbi:hypothetical protein CIW83_18115 [Tissierella sp. P1]|uniref:hypothetical protein n=1 Tax=Tissierella sp. P1 TaxID=1280483 RepID=UPI000BA130CE|nr:hypothetical protein [Tissierella sp. P1]OZV10841.1 hypothetical protein CIW83_18115 [Tissierella sp. P1]